MWRHRPSVAGRSRVGTIAESAMREPIYQRLFHAESASRLGFTADASSTLAGVAHAAVAGQGRPANMQAEATGGLRILAVGNMYPPHHAGGYELMWQRAMRYAASLGHQVRVLASDYREDSKREEEDPDVHRTLRWYWDLHSYQFPHLNLMQRLWLELRNAAELRRHLRDFKPELVTWWSMGCMSLSMIEQVRRRGIPAAFIVHDDWLVYGWDHDQWMRTWIGPRRGKVAPVAERICGVPTRVDASRAGSFIFNSRYTLSRAREVRQLTAPAVVIHPGIEERFLEPLPPRPWKWHLLYAGRIDRQKGIDTAVEALAHLPSHATFSVWGNGDQHYIAEMKSTARRLGLADRVQFHPFASVDQMRSVYEAADAVVFPVRWNEPFGLVPLEAMALGRPVVTTARGGTAEFVRDGHNALVFEAGDTAGLASCVDRLARQEALRFKLREGGRKTASQYIVGSFAERTVDEILRAAAVSSSGVQSRPLG